jgi:tetratricopeptide (TPR) repeat protein
LARLTRHDLKKDEFRTTFGEFEHFVRRHFNEIATVVGILVVVVGSAFALKLHKERQEAEAGAQLGAALRTFRAYVGPASPDNPLPVDETFTTAQAKYKKALQQFTQITQKFPRTKAAGIAAYHEGVCQAELGDSAAAIRTLHGASDASHDAIASLTRLALANELATSGKLSEAQKLYQELAEHPTVAVPRATALLEMADAYRTTQPAQARQIYDRLEKEFSSDATIAQAIKQQIASLPH